MRRRVRVLYTTSPWERYLGKGEAWERERLPTSHEGKHDCLAVFTNQLTVHNHPLRCLLVWNLSPTQALVLASFPGPTQFSAAWSTEKRFLVHVWGEEVRKWLYSFSGQNEPGTILTSSQQVAGPHNRAGFYTLAILSWGDGVRNLSGHKKY